jgi:hypothetical protein
MEKRSHLGMAGHHAAMSEFLYRGYNVAVPAVDVGDDVYIVEDRQGTMWRLQVKTSDHPGGASRTFQLSRRQLREEKANELFFMFLARRDRRWHFILIDRKRLAAIRREFERADRFGIPGRKPRTDTEAKADAITFRIAWRDADAFGWGASLTAYLDRWPELFPERPDGPGAARVAALSPDP